MSYKWLMTLQDIDVWFSHTEGKQLCWNRLSIVSTCEFQSLGTLKHATRTSKRFLLIRAILIKFSVRSRELTRACTQSRIAPTARMAQMENGWTDFDEAFYCRRLPAFANIFEFLFETGFLHGGICGLLCADMTRCESKRCSHCTFALGIFS